MDERARFNNPSIRNLGVVAVVAAAHLAVLRLLGSDLSTTTLEAVRALPTVIVDLVRPEIPPPPPTRPRTVGGGAPAPSSRIHLPPPPVTPVNEVLAPPTPGPVPGPLVSLSAPSPSADASGQGGAGTGEGRGSGEGFGTGPAIGVVTPARWISGPSRAEIDRRYPRAAVRTGQAGRATLRCDVLLNTRLSDCSVVDEAPAGLGFGAAALAVSRHFRLAPGTLDGQPLDRQEIVIAVDFQPRPAAATSAGG